MALLGPAEIRDLAATLDLQPTKKLGQNFVVDGNTVRKIVKTARVEPGDEVLEVGPGLGSLTLGLLDAGARVTAVEIDTRLAELLPHTVEALTPGAPLEVVTGDALRVGIPGSPRRLVANLPYNVSVPVLLHLLESVKAAWYGRWSTAGTVSRQVFWPVPNVDSILVAFERGDAPGTEEERVRTFAIVDAAFGQRRKMLRQALADLLGGSATASAVLESAGVDPTLRGEQLLVADFLRIARA
jgi:16S rRNA (adenine1518-N6/adenine1519-N6)-dimethyltransferase